MVKLNLNSYLNLNYQFQFNFKFFFLLFISWFVFTNRWYSDKLWNFHVNQTIYLSWSTSEIRVRLVPSNMFKPSSKLFVFHVCHAVLSVHCSLAGKGLVSWLSCMWCFHVFRHFLMCCPGSGVLLDCIDSWFLLSPLLWSKKIKWNLIYKKKKQLCEFNIRFSQKKHTRVWQLFSICKHCI